jgi:hypothetical protein
VFRSEAFSQPKTLYDCGLFGKKSSAPGWAEQSRLCCAVWAHGLCRVILAAAQKQNGGREDTAAVVEFD